MSKKIVIVCITFIVGAMVGLGFEYFIQDNQDTKMDTEIIDVNLVD